ncbi:MAG: MAPEG family protein [Yoonia sp.]|uniref:MAPEG family protein n=1 Tax=Yoonia sp. TaxID=2212373 RepID=UPI00273ED828|nr:MAPEG family protein [Yoonia sp.]MDP5084731.1 MAPEG family protein [Yoonia sp.]MDP5360836.1 MAPEG family protein [Paracoccaceae bacterium]
MTPELQYLVYGVILLIAHTLVQATFSDLSKGLGWALGPQDEKRDQNVVAARIERALRNYLETFPAFIALALILSVTGLGNATSALGAAVWFWARIAYIPAYASGVPLIRSVAWFASLFGLAMMIVPLF